MTGEYTLDELAVPESLGRLHELLERVAVEHPEVSPQDLMLLETAVIEIAGNVVEHGLPPGEVHYAFRLDVRPDRLECWLSDSGDAMPSDWDSGTMPPADEVTGRGLALARAALDELSYARAGEANLWRMTRYRAVAS